MTCTAAFVDDNNHSHLWQGQLHPSTPKKRSLVSWFPFFSFNSGWKTAAAAFNNNNNNNNYSLLQQQQQQPPMTRRAPLFQDSPFFDRVDNLHSCLWWGQQLQPPLTPTTAAADAKEVVPCFVIYLFFKFRLEDCSSCLQLWQQLQPPSMTTTAATNDKKSSLVLRFPFVLLCFFTGWMICTASLSMTTTIATFNTNSSSCWCQRRGPLFHDFPFEIF